MPKPGLFSRSAETTDMRLFIPALLFLEALGEYRYLGMSPAGKVGIPSLPLPVGTVNSYLTV